MLNNIKQIQILKLAKVRLEEELQYTQTLYKDLGLDIKKYETFTKQLQKDYELLDYINEELLKNLQRI